MNQSCKKKNKKDKLDVLAKLILFVAVIMAILYVYYITEPKFVVADYTYVSCDRLWDLTKYCPQKMDKRDFISEIIELNGMSDSVVHSNRLYQIPVYEVER